MFTPLWSFCSNYLLLFFFSAPLSCFYFQTMSKMQRHQQEALWEFVHTELTYINKLIIITDVICQSLPAVIVSFKYSLSSCVCFCWKGIFHRMFNKALSASHSWLSQLFSTYTSMDFSWRSVRRVCSLIFTSNTGLLHGTLNLKAYFPLFCIPLTHIQWHNNNIRSGLDRVQHTSGKCSTTTDFHWEDGKYHKAGEFSCNAFNSCCVLTSCCDRWPLSCCSPTFPPSSSHTSCSGRRWFIPCYMKSGGQASPLTPWG